MAFKYKHKQVRNAAKEALSLAAKTRGITEEEPRGSACSRPWL